MATVINPFVTYLSRYTTASPDHEAAFDEFLVHTPPPSGAPLQLATRVEQFLSAHFARKHPASVILTGNAGDGKTYLCRQVVAAFAGRPLDDWDAIAKRPLERDGVRLHVIKDLSELGEDQGAQILDALAQSLTGETADRFLIAANEGRLRHLLNDHPRLRSLQQDVERQLRDGPATESDALIVLNLTHVTTSSFVPAALAWMADAAHWEACAPCPIRDACPLRWNSAQLRDPRVVSRIQLLYRVLEHLDIHVTVRDMLIHLAYTVAGNSRCHELQRAVAEHKDLSRLVYYENIWGRDGDSAFQRKASVVQHLARLRIGSHSLFAIDDFIVSGSGAEHEALFAPAVDLNHRRFAQDREAYLNGAADRDAADEQQAMLEWLPHCRRKLFFAWERDDQVIRLIPFLALEQYLAILQGDRSAKRQILRELVRGLNRAFARIFLTESDYLYVTTQYLHSVEQPRPLVRLRFPLTDLELALHERGVSAYDCDHPALELIVAPPASLRRDPSRVVEPVRWRIGLLSFEYLLRLAHGGTYTILAEECELAIRGLKDRLLSAFGAAGESDEQLEFFVADQNRYTLRQIRVDEHDNIQGST